MKAHISRNYNENYHYYINNAQLLCFSVPMGSMSQSAERIEFCRASDGQFFIAEYNCFCKRSDAKITFFTDEDAKEFVRRFGPECIYKELFG